jgi:hypothetical protein
MRCDVAMTAMQFMGGDVVRSNVIFNMVRETGDHGTFNR